MKALARCSRQYSAAKLVVFSNAYCGCQIANETGMLPAAVLSDLKRKLFKKTGQCGISQQLVASKFRLVKLYPRV